MNRERAETYLRLLAEAELRDPALASPPAPWSADAPFVTAPVALARAAWALIAVGALDLETAEAILADAELAAAALIDQAIGHRTGLWNPAIYGFATSARSPFTPLSAQGTGNDNLYYTGTPGQVFNPGSGLGYPDLAKLARDFG